MGLILALTLGTIGAFAPAAAKSFTAQAAVPDIHNLAPIKAKPDFDKDVLTPLRAHQKAKAVVDAQIAEQARLDAIERQRLLDAQRVVQAYQAPAIQPNGDCSTWLAGAGITDVANAMFILNHESGCNPFAWNASSGAGGLAQALPFSKMGCALGDGQCQMNWFRSYVEGRYGTFASAVAFWRGHNWY